MKVAVVAPSPVPYTFGGAERVAAGLHEAINDQTPHDAELIKIPSREHSFAQLVDSYASFARLDLSHFDVVISSKYPAWMVHHPNHRVYMFHPLRGLYDTYHLFGLPERADHRDGELALLYRALRSRPSPDPSDVLGAAVEAVLQLGPDHPAFAFPGPLSRELVQWLDGVALSRERCIRHLAISDTVARRPGYFPPDVHVNVVPPPSSLTGFHSGGADYLFSCSRLDGPKRFDLLIRAMGHVPSDVRLVIAGTGPDRERLEQLAAGDPRVSFAGFVTDEELVDLYASALAVAFVPQDEDLGLITLEAQMSAKPVVTCSDSGGPTELVADGISGFVAAPNPAALGAALSRLCADPALARRMGEAGRQTAAGITWESVVHEVLGPARPRQRRAASGGSSQPLQPDLTLLRRGLPRLLALSTYPAAPARGGGQLRCLHLLSALTDEFDITYVALDQDGTGRHELVREGFEQIVVPRSGAQLKEEFRLAEQAGIPVTDIAAALTARDNPELVALVRAVAERSSLLVLEHPYLLPLALQTAPHLPLVYDSHNAEYEMKAALLPASPTGRWLAEVVTEVERTAVRRASSIVACSSEDAAALARLGPTLAEVTVIPNGTDTRARPFVTGAARVEHREQLLGAYRAAGLAEDARRIAIFVASYHPPNNEAADHIVRMAPELPDVLFSLIGSHCNHLQDRALPPNVVLAGIVDDAELDVLLRSADVALNPMTSGSGTNLKLLESFAAGVPVVATPFGARGIDLVAGEHALLVGIEGFAAGIRASLDDTAGASRRAAQARVLVEARYDWTVLGAQLAQVVRASIASAIGTER